MNVTIFIFLFLLSLFSLSVIAWVNLVEDKTKTAIRDFFKRFRGRKRDNTTNIETGTTSQMTVFRSTRSFSQSVWRGFVWIFKLVLWVGVILFLIGIFSLFWDMRDTKNEKTISYREQVLTDPDFAFAKSIVEEQCVAGCAVDRIITIKAGETEKLLRDSFPLFASTDYISDGKVDILNKEGRKTVIEHIDPAKNHLLCDLRQRVVNPGAIYARPVDTTKDTHIVMLTIPVLHYSCR